MTSPGDARPVIRNQQRSRLLLNLEARLEGPMFLLAVLWLWLFLDEVFTGASDWQTLAVTAIWACFVVEFALKLSLAPRKLEYALHNWITLVALIVPVFRLLRILRILQVLQTVRAASMFQILRGMTSGRRLYRELRDIEGPTPEPEMNVAILIARSPDAEVDALYRLADQIGNGVRPEIEAATKLEWKFDVTEPTRLESDDLRQPADFLDDASLRMAEGPYDLAVVLTNVGLVSRRRRVVGGIASRTARVAVISTRKLTTPPRREPARHLDDEDVRWNAAALLLQLLGQIGGLKPAPAGRSDAMAPFVFRTSRRALPRFNRLEREALARTASELPERELRGGNALISLAFHVLMALRHPGDVARPLLRNRALLLPLSLPGLATAAVVPTFVLVFTAEIWDVGLSITTTVAAGYATASVLAASFYLAWAQALFLPRKEKRVLTEHLAVANTVIYLSILLACIGLFLMVGTLMLLIEVFLFPSDLMQTWPTLQHPEVGFGDKLRLAAFISTVGTTTGALAGGLESRAVIRQLALFEEEIGWREVPR